MNRFEGVHPDFTGYDLVLTPKKKRYLQSLADSKSVLDRRLCLEYLANHDEVKSNARFVLGIWDQLIHDSDFGVSIWALIQVRNFVIQKLCIQMYNTDSKFNFRKLDETELKQKLGQYDTWDPVAQAWPMIVALCSTSNDTVRARAASLLLTPLLNGHINQYFLKAMRLIESGDKRFLASMSRCRFRIQDIGVENFEKVEGFISQRLKGEKLRGWKTRCNSEREGTETIPDASPKAPPKLGRNRLFGREAWEVRHVVQLNREERDYLISLSTSRRKKDRMMSLELFDHPRRYERNKSLFHLVFDRLLTDNSIEIRSYAAFALMAAGGETGQSFKLILKHGSSNSPATQRMIAIGPLREFVHWNQGEGLEKVCNAVERGNEHFARTVSQMLLWNMEAEWFDRLDSVLGKHLDRREFNQWRKRCRLFREDMEQ